MLLFDLVFFIGFMGVGAVLVTVVQNLQVVNDFFTRQSWLTSCLVLSDFPSIVPRQPHPNPNACGAGLTKFQLRRQLQGCFSAAIYLSQ